MADVRPIDANKFEEYLKKAFGKFDLCFLLVGAIRSEPTLDYAPVMLGEWVEQEDFCGDPYYTCSACKNNWVCVDGTPAENGMRYCPNCGAKMDGGKTDA